MSRLSYNRQVLLRIREAYEHASREELLDDLVRLFKLYVTEGTVPFNIPLPEAAEAGAERNGAGGGARGPLADEPLPDGSAPNAPDEPKAEPTPQQFARLIDQIKKRAGHLPQLDGFSVESGRVTLTVDNQRVTFGERTTVEFIPSRAPRGSAAAAAASAPSGTPLGSVRSALASGAKLGPPLGPAGAAAKDAPAKGGAPKKPDAGGGADAGGGSAHPDLADVDHIIERFRRLDMD